MKANRPLEIGCPDVGRVGAQLPRSNSLDQLCLMSPMSMMQFAFANWVNNHGGSGGVGMPSDLQGVGSAMSALAGYT